MYAQVQHTRSPLSRSAAQRSSRMGTVSPNRIRLSGRSTGDGRVSSFRICVLEARPISDTAVTMVRAPRNTEQRSRDGLTTERASPPRSNDARPSPPQLAFRVLASAAKPRRRGETTTYQDLTEYVFLTNFFKGRFPKNQVWFKSESHTL